VFPWAVNNAEIGQFLTPAHLADHAWYFDWCNGQALLDRHIAITHLQAYKMATQTSRMWQFSPNSYY